MQRFSRSTLIVVSLLLLTLCAIRTPAARGASQNAALFAPLRALASYLGLAAPVSVPQVPETAPKDSEAPDTPLRLAKSTAKAAPKAIRPRAVTFTVTETGDEPDFATTDGVCDINPTTIGNNCTLRAAIEQANATAGADTINFALSGTGVQGIPVTSPLPPITETVVIDGYSQPGASVNTLNIGDNANILVALDGSDAGSAVNGLTISGAANCVIKGLNIHNFSGSAVVIQNSAATGNVVGGCFIGTTNNGLEISPNGNGITISNSATGNTIGGPNVAFRNLISGNDGIGVILQARTSSNTVQGNYIGVNSAGTAALGNSQGVQINSTGNTIGGTLAGAGNVISGNTGLGLGDTGDGSANPVGNTIQGNIIGLSADQNAKVPNNIGIQISSRDNDIIGALGAGRNVISGNGQEGISLFQNFATGNDNNIIQGNKIGTNDSGAALGNGADGIFLGGVGNSIRSNSIISNGGHGILVQNGTDNLIQQNNIGIAGQGNAGSGVYLSLGAQNNSIGANKDDATPGPEGNLIAGNLTGVSVNSTLSDATGNSIRGNTIEGNTALGINLNGDGGSGDAVTPNDDDLSGATDDADTGNNNLQNFPNIVALVGNNIIGNFHSTPNTNFHLDFYDNTTPDGSGFGEGSLLLTSQPVRTDANGDVNFSFGPVSISGTVTGTATNRTTGDTSEFSQGRSAAPTLSISDVTLTEGDTGTATATFTVTLSAASTQTITVNHATANNTATQPADYTQTTGTTTFTPGQTVQIITVPVQSDILDEANETFFVNLSTPTNATIADAQGLGTISDNDAAPSVRINNVSVTEANTSPTGATFTVTLSALSGQNVFVDYTTADGTATAPGDYTTTNGTLTIPAGTLSGTIVVPVQGDTLFEPSETFFLNLIGASNATIADNQGIGTILNDDVSFVVTTAADNVDAGDGLTSLREAITAANATAGAQTISFAISGTGVQTIDVPTGPTNGLPAITETVTIDGYTQPGASANTLSQGSNAALRIALNGNSTGPTSTAPALTINAADCIIRGLAIGNFGTDAILISGTAAARNKVEGCFIGTDATGTTANANDGGVRIEAGATFNTIGGTAAAARNLISGNILGVSTSGANTNNNTIAGNLIGSDAAGTSAIPNTDGVTIIGNINAVGVPNGGNLISGNSRRGVSLPSASTTNTKVQGNTIGLGTSGAALPNGQDGVFVQLATSSLIGGTTATTRNVISGNGGNGINVLSGTTNQIRGNFISANGGLGIDLGNNGITANDAGDADSGANNLQNFPVVTGVTFSGGNTIVAMSLTSAPGAYSVDLFSNIAADASGNGEGETFVTAQSVTVPAGGSVAFSSTVTGTANRFYSATATDPAGNTSEFSGAVQTPPAVQVVTWNGGAGVWSDTSKWTGLPVGAAFPNNGTPANTVYDVRIDGSKTGTASVVALNVNVTVSKMTLDIGDSLSIDTERSLALANSGSGTGLITNNGTLNSGVKSHIFIDGTVTLAGSGKLIMSDTPQFDATGIGGVTPAARLINGPNHTIQGGGVLGFFNQFAPVGPLNITNQGIIDATGTNPLRIDPTDGAGGFINTGTVRSTGGFLGIQNGSITNTGGTIAAQGINTLSISGCDITAGTISAGNNGGVSLDTVTFTNSTLATTGTGTIYNVGTGINHFVLLNNVILNGAFDAGTQTDTTIQGTLTNNGTLSSGVKSHIFIDGTVTLAGSGKLIMSDTPQFDATGIGGVTPAARLINGPNHTIQGAGVLGFFNQFAPVGPLNLTNRGTILANGTNPLQIDPTDGAGGFVNSGIINVVTGSLLSVPGPDSYTQTAGTTTVNGTLNVPGIALQGGTLNGSGTLNGPISNSAGNVAPGTSPGLLTENANYAQSGTGKLTMEINGATVGTQYDQLKINGSVILGGTLTVTAGFSPAVGAAFTLIDNDGTDAVTGTFAGLAQNATVNASGQPFRISYTGGDGNDVTLTRTVQNFVVDTVSDANLTGCTAAAGDCSLRGAINNANANVGADIISFAISGTGAQTIAPATPLPIISEAVTIDGSTQPGFGGTPLIVLSGQNAGVQPPTSFAAALQITADNCVVRSLCINNGFPGGVSIFGTTGNALASNNKIEGCFFGTNAAGTAVSELKGSGILLSNGGVASNGATANIIGGTTAAQRNIINSNKPASGFGVAIEGAATSGNRVIGNYIGTNVAGTGAIGNSFGIGLSSDAHDNLIGGTTAAERNIIAGNDTGVLIYSNSNTVQGNYIGTDRTGNVALANAISGVMLDAGASGNTIGGVATTPGTGRGNVISGNGVGVEIIGRSFGTGAFSSGNAVQGNVIGLMANGTSALANGTGVLVKQGGATNSIGGATAGAGNVVSGNGGHGIHIFDTATSGNSVRGNFIGTNSAGANFGNTLSGIAVDGAAATTIGGIAAGQSNEIAFNGQDGVRVSNGASGVSIRANVTHDNLGLGINLVGGTEDASGVTQNDATDSDTGANGLQNYPDITVTQSAPNGPLTITGTLVGVPGRQYQCDFYFNLSPDASGFGEGRQHVFTSTATLNASGTGTFTGAPFTPPPGVLLWGTGTATDTVTGNTSEFSKAVKAEGGPTITSFTSVSGPRGSIVTINGTNFTGATAVQFGGNNTTLFTVNSATRITATVPATAVSGPIGVIAPTGTGTSPANFTVTAGYVVTNTNDANAGSLREGINYANNFFGNNSGATTNINFGIPGTGVKTIQPLSSLPAIARQVTFDGYTQSGANANTNAAGALNGTLTVEISGPAANGSALRVNANNCVLRGLIINRFSNSSGVIFSGNNNRVEGCYLGTNSTGLAGFGTGSTNTSNGNGVSVSGGTGNIIGGSVAAARNLISGNRINGVGIVGPSGTAGNTLVQGNIIGLNKTGTALLGGGQIGVSVSGFTTNTIGGSTGNLGNIISGNVTGIQLFSNANTVQSNLIGTDVSGTLDLGNSGTGIYIQTGQNNLIGGLAASPGQEPGNVISGNDTGLDVRGNNTTIQGNLIGTNAAGTGALPNTQQGIASQSSAVTIGGSASSARNVISGNGREGIIFSIAGGNSVQGNSIGTAVDGTSPLGNGGAGININSVNNNIIGTALGNTIAFNDGDGVRVAEFGGNGVNNRIQSNKIFGNTRLGINLVGGTGENAAGVTPNDETTAPFDSDAGANRQQNAPVLTSVVNEATGTRVLGTLKSTPSTTFRIEFFENAAADPSGFGEGQIFRRAITVGTDASGNAALNTVISPTVAIGRFISATSIAPTGDTSEFSQAQAVRAALPTLRINDVTVTEGDSGTQSARFTVTLSAVSLTPVTVNYATANGTATQPSDYALSSGTLTIPAEFTSGIISVPIVGDTAIEPNETFFVNLTAPSGATLSDAQGLGTIVNDDSAPVLPTLTIGNQGLPERNSGLTPIDFLVTLSAPAASPVTVRYSTALGGANPATPGTSSASGADYVAVSNVLLTIPAGQTTTRIVVSAFGDELIEGNETFVVNLSSPVGATIFDGQGLGTIRNDDAPFDLTVDTTSDADLGTCTDAAGDCSLRGAIRRANLDANPQTIGFAIPGSGVPTITLTRPLPVINQPVTIDGFSQNPSLGQPAVHIDGDIVANGLDLRANNSLIKGLSITECENAGIRITGDNNHVQGCWLGTRNGTTSLGNEQSGLELSGGANNNLVGGSGAARNLISGNLGNGVLISGLGTTGNRVQGNYIGTAKDGVGRLANITGISIASGAADNVIGGAAAGSGNIVSGNSQSGIELSGNGNRVQGNLIGVNKNSAALANGGSGLNVLNGSGSTIGTVGTGANTIRFNGGAGINLGNGVTSAAIRGNVISNNVSEGVKVGGNAKGVTIRGNVHKRNGKLGINLVGGTEITTGVTPNDTAANDADSGANNLQNYPALGEVAQAGLNDRLLLKGSLRSTPSRTFIVDVYSSQAQDPSRFGEGEVTIGAFTVQTNTAGAASFTRALTLPAGQGDARSQYITLTATDSTTGDTSEFSFAKQVSAAFTPLVVEPNVATIQPCESQQFTATLAGIPFADVLWSVTNSDGSAVSTNVQISPTGVFTSQVEGTFTVTATSKLTPGAKANATITVATQTGFFGWGHNSAGSVGDGTTTNKLGPVSVALPATPTIIAAGGTHSLAVAGGKLFAWGQNSDYQLGLGNNTIRTTPTQVTAIDGSKVTALACGWYHSLAVVGGEVYAWGYNRYAQCGKTPDTATPHVLVPFKVPGLTNVVEVSAGVYFSMARKSDGSVWAWGSSLYGQGGPAAAAVQVAPVRVALSGSATQIGAGAAHAAALVGGQVFAWGLNETGQLGNGQSGVGLQTSRPVRAGTLSGMTLLSVGYAHTLAANASQPYSWGDNGKNQLGRSLSGAATFDSTPGLITGLSGVTQLAAGSVHNLAVKSDGTVWSWGYGPFGSLGLGDAVNRATPQHITALRNVGQVAAGYAHSFAVAKQDLCFGSLRADKDTYQQPLSAPVYPASGTAWSSNDSIALDMDSLGKAPRFFRVSVNGSDIEVQGVQSAKDSTMLLLPKGTLQVGDKVVVSWNSLADGESQTLTLRAE